VSKFNSSTVSAAIGSGPIHSSDDLSIFTHEGAPAHPRDTKSELFLLAVVNMVGEDTFYESSDERDLRFRSLVRQVAVDDPHWTKDFLTWLRKDANIRTASMVGALEAARAMVAAKIPGARRIVSAVLQRADEPGEALAYWSTRYGRKLPMPVKRGVADAALRLYNERALLKYDTASHGFRFGDVIELTHPKPILDWQHRWQTHLFRHAIERRHNRGNEIHHALQVLHANAKLRIDAAVFAPVLLDADKLKRAGMTWEDALSLAGERVDKAQLWEAIIPSMGIMALARNLRNFDEAGVSDVVAAQVAARFADPLQVATSRMFPFRWLSAYEQAPSLRWGHALDQALQSSLAALPRLPGRTLILVDTSASMTNTGLSARSKVTPLKAAAIFGVALAANGEQVDLVGFASAIRPFHHGVPVGASVIREVARFIERVGEDGHQTYIAAAIAKTYNGHNRVIVISDMQTMDATVSRALPASVPLYGFNLGGYRPTVIPNEPNRIELGGLTDATFRLLPLLEAGRDGAWPWLPF
jgi:hypothetical protein